MIMRMINIPGAATLALLLASCGPTYTLVAPARIGVARNSMVVEPGIAWNRVPKSALDLQAEERWTQNGPLLDSVSFIGAVPEGTAIVKQRAKDLQQVPLFRANMSPDDIVAMIEANSRIHDKAREFKTIGVKPVTFLEKAGLQLDYDYIGGDDVMRRGRSVVAIIDMKLYVITLDGLQSHYFAAALPEFEAMVRSARR